MNDRKSMNFEADFGLSEGHFKDILNVALDGGGEFAEIYLEHNVFNHINMEEDIIKETSESLGLGMGIRVHCGEKTGYAYTNDFSLDKIKRAAGTASTIAKGNQRQRSAAIVTRTFPHNYYPVLNPVHLVNLEQKIEIVKSVHQAAKNADPRIQRVKVSYADLAQHIQIFNSEGLNISDSRPLIKCTCLAVAEESKKREAGFSGGGGRVGIEYFQNSLTPEEIGAQAAQEALHLLKAEHPPAGEMPVILAPGHSGVLIHESVGHLLEADFIRKKTSIFWNKLGQKVASPQVNIYDDPTIPSFRGTYNIDDEGTEPMRTPLILEGRLVGLLQDRLSAKLLKHKLTGHGRRQDFTCIPIPRMSNTYIDGGSFDPEEILKSVKFGFYAHKYQGGQVEDSGKFTFSVSSGFLIEDGKLTRPVKQATLIGSNIDILNKIEMVGDDLQFGQQTGTCGKEGQAAPVSDGCPTIKISKMTVGGQE